MAQLDGQMVDIPATPIVPAQDGSNEIAVLGERYSAHSRVPAKVCANPLLAIRLREAHALGVMPQLRHDGVVCRCHRPDDDDWLIVVSNFHRSSCCAQRCSN